MAPPTARPSPSPSAAPHGTSQSNNELSGGAIAGIVVGSFAGLVLLAGAAYVVFLQCGGKSSQNRGKPAPSGDMESGQSRVHPFISGPGMLSLTEQQSHDVDLGVVPAPASTVDNHHSGSSDLSQIYPNVGEGNFSHNTPRGAAEEAVMMSSVALRPVSVDYVGI
mmetsp:Transcript_14352/g.19638  ORF Transcript_14352/g.19638 Transcript_14352/m.19638 type:complete len:165 (-) Transcript_14352:265-759(-)